MVDFPSTPAQEQQVIDFYLSNDGGMAYEVYTLWGTLPGADSLPYRSVLVRLSDGEVLAKAEQYDAREQGLPYIFDAFAAVDDADGDLLLMANGAYVPPLSSLPGYLLWRGSQAGDVVSVIYGVVGQISQFVDVTVASPDAELAASQGSDFFPLPPL